MSKHIKIISIGDFGVGKSSYIKAITHPNLLFPSKTDSTIEVDFTPKKEKICDNMFYCNYWDLGAGMSQATCSSYFRQMNVLLLHLSIDVGNKEQNIKNWIQLVMQHYEGNHASLIPVLLVVNKVDLVENDEEMMIMLEMEMKDIVGKVKEEMKGAGLELLGYYFTSAMKRKNVRESMDEALAFYVNNEFKVKKEQYDRENNFQKNIINLDQKKKKKNVCANS